MSRRVLTVEGDSMRGMNDTPAVAARCPETSTAPHPGLTAEDRRRIRDEDRAEARRELGSLLRLSRDRCIRTGR